MSSGGITSAANGEHVPSDIPSPKLAEAKKVSQPTLDDFGLPIRPPSRARLTASDDGTAEDDETFHDAEESGPKERDQQRNGEVKRKELEAVNGQLEDSPSIEDEKSAPTSAVAPQSEPETKSEIFKQESQQGQPSEKVDTKDNEQASVTAPRPVTRDGTRQSLDTTNELSSSPIYKRDKPATAPAVSEWSHQKLAPREEESDYEEEVAWQAMPALGEFDVYDDDGRIVAKGSKLESDDAPYVGIGGAGKGYTRVLLDEDAQSATSLDEDTSYLFKGNQKQNEEDDEEQRDALAQMQTTKDLLTEGQRIAYVGVVRLTMYKMLKALEDMERTKGTKKELIKALESMEMWGQQIMVRVYTHMEIDSAEQIMIEQLAEHGVQPSDLVPPLMQNAKVQNPMADGKSADALSPDPASGGASDMSQASTKAEDSVSEDVKRGEEVPEVHGVEDMPTTNQIELDLRWTVLCDLFLLLVNEGVYDARSRRLLERVATSLQISWVQICRFEKRVIDQLEMQEAEMQENWNETDNMEKRRKMGLTKKYVVMGLATVGGGLVIGLSAGLLAPVIGAGLAAGFSTIGVAGTAGFLGGVGGAAIITTTATAAGGTIAVRASNRRTGHVKTFEYRPLHNNKRLNLILTVSGWMSGKVDDVRLPFSTVDPIMGDIYSLLWEPEMLQSMGDTINILATEALTSTIQQVLGSTILVTLMASLQLPVVLTKLSYLIDNPWTVSLDRANAAGLILADSLIDRHLGQRPITLVGFSLGSRLIFSCLRELAARGAYGIVQNVYLFGSPIVAKKDEYLRARSVISGRFVNGYASNDWILGYLFRATSGGIMRVAGLAPVEGVPGLENLDLTKIVNGHMAYRASMPRLLREVGWEVESEEFSEIEDPDPENHAQRQRELINEIEEARKKAEQRPEKKRFGFFKLGKAAEKKGWETYEPSHKKSPSSAGEGKGSPGLESNVLFDIDAIRRELAGEQIDVRELNSTMPPMQISTMQNGKKHTEYLRLPPGLKPEEMAKIKLPPRPTEIDSGSSTPANVSRRGSPSATPRMTPSTTPRLQQDEEYVFEGPKELVTTLPALSLTPSLPSKSYTSPTPPVRPDLKTHATTPAGAAWSNSSIMPSPALASPIEALSLERNAWANDDNRHDGEIKMTFE